MHSLGKILLAFALLYFVFQGQTCLFFQVFLDFLLLHSNTLWWTGHLFFFFGISSRRSSRSSQNWSTSASLTLLAGAYTWVTVMLNDLPSKWAKIILSFLRLYQSIAFWTLVESSESYSISSTGFLPTVVDIMVIWIKFTHSVHWFLRCWCSLLPSPAWPSLTYLDSWTYHSRFLHNTVVYSIGFYFHHQTHPELNAISASAQPH